MALPVYSYSSIPTDVEFNAFLRPAFDKDEGQEEFPGHLRRLRDDSLSNDATQIKKRFERFENELKVSAGVGRTITYQGGSNTLDSGIIAVIAPGSIILPDNAISYVYAVGNTVVSSTILPVRWTPMARVTTSGGVVTQVEDIRERFKTMPVARAIATFGSGGYEGDLTISSNISLGGVRYVRNLTVDLAATVTVVGGYLYIKASGNVVINGTINVNSVVSPGAGFGGTVNAGFVFFGLPGTGLGRSPGHNISAAPSYPYQASSGLGSSGSSGLVAMSPDGWANIFTSNGGMGAGAIFIEAAGSITVAGAINAVGGNASIGVINALGTPSTIVNLTGASGGTGGTIVLSSLTSLLLLAGSLLSVRGGNSSAAVRSSSSTNGINGCGGSGGGYIVLQSPTLSVNGSATLNVSGGSGGAGIIGDPVQTYGSLAGSSFAGIGGGQGLNNTTGLAGGNGQIIQQTFAPI